MTIKQLENSFNTALSGTKVRLSIDRENGNGSAFEPTTYEGQITFKQNSIPFVIDVYGFDALIYEIRCDLSALNSLVKTDLFDLIGFDSKIPEPWSILPDELGLKQDLLESITIQELRFSFTQQDIISAGIKVKFDTSILLDLGLLKVDELIFDFNAVKITNQKPRLSCFINCNTSLGNNIKLSTGITIPELQLMGSLQGGTEISLNNLINKIVDEPLNGIPDVSIADLDVYADFRSKAFGFSVLVESDWSISMGGSEDFAIKSLEFSLDKQPAPAQLQINARGIVEIADTEIAISATHSQLDRWTFRLESEEGHELPIGELFAFIGNKFGKVELPDAIKDLTITKLFAEFGFKSNEKSFQFELDVRFPLGDHEMDLGLYFSSLDMEVRGEIIYEREHRFTVDFKKSDGEKLVLAAYSNPNGLNVPISNFVDRFNPDLADFLPDISVLIKDAFGAFIKHDPNPWRFLLGLDVGLTIGLDITHMPLIGDKLPEDVHFKLENLRVMVASATIDEKELSVINGVLSTIEIPTIETTSGSGSEQHPALKKGFTIAAEFEVPGLKNGLDLKWTKAQGQAIESGEGSANTPQQATQVQKNLGPLHIQNIGMGFSNGELKFNVTGSLSMAGIELALMGFEVASAIDDFNPKFALKGLGLDVKKGPLELSAAFLKETYDVGLSTEYDEYMGMLTLKFKALSLSGLGAYANYEGHPSLFLYAFLGYPFGGPPAFFVNGLALGFGLNRSIVPPPISQVADFPLIQLAVPTAPIPQDNAKSSLDKIMKDLHTFIPPSVGDYWMAAGIRFRSFGIISNFSLAIVKFGHDIEIDILGVANVILPSAFIELQYIVRFVPSEGYVLAQGELTSRSYLFAPVVHLTGGFAVGFWFSGDNAGDFVVSIGGYHPDFDVPAHYPSAIPRLALNWHLSSAMSIKGGMYFALTPKAMMGGGFLDATFDGGIIQAWLKINADFIIYWEPFHYDATISVEIGAEVNIDMGLFDLSFSLSLVAQLHIWGPEFSGTASLDLGVKTFELSFGAGSSPKADPITFEAFKKAFLPKKKDAPDAYDICSIVITNGLIKKSNWGSGSEKREIWIVNPKELTLVTDAVIPFTKFQFKEDSFDFSTAKSLDQASYLDLTATTTAALDDQGTQTLIADQRVRTSATIGNPSMAPVQPTSFDSGQLITVRRDENRISNEFTYAPIFKNVPAALWGAEMPDSTKINSKSPTLVKNVLSGFELKPAVMPNGGQSHSMDRRVLAFNLDEYDGDFDLSRKLKFDPHYVRKDENWMVTQKGARDLLIAAFSEHTEVTAVLDEELPNFSDPHSLALLNQPIIGKMKTLA